MTRLIGLLSLAFFIAAPGVLLGASGGGQPCEKDGVEYGVVEGNFREEWYSYQERGESYLAGECHDLALDDFSRALELRSSVDRAANRPGCDQRRARTYGMHFVDFFGHREKGVAHFYLGEIDQALEELNLSLECTESSRAQFYLDKTRRDQLQQQGGDLENPQVKSVQLLYVRPTVDYQRLGEPQAAKGCDRFIASPYYFTEDEIAAMKSNMSWLERRRSNLAPGWGNQVVSWRSADEVVNFIARQDELYFLVETSDDQGVDVITAEGAKSAETFAMSQRSDLYPIQFEDDCLSTCLIKNNYTSDGTETDIFRVFTAVEYKVDTQTEETVRYETMYVPPDFLVLCECKIFCSCNDEAEAQYSRNKDQYIHECTNRKEKYILEEAERLAGRDSKKPTPKRGVHRQEQEADPENPFRSDNKMLEDPLYISLSKKNFTNTFTFTVKDIVDRTFKGTVHFILDKEGPQVSFDEVVPLGDKARVKGRVSDQTGISHFTIEGVEPRKTGEDSFYAIVPLNQGSFKFEIVDLAGNKTEGVWQPAGPKKKTGAWLLAPPKLWPGAPDIIEYFASNGPIFPPTVRTFGYGASDLQGELWDDEDPTDDGLDLDPADASGEDPWTLTPFLIGEPKEGGTPAEADKKEEKPKAEETSKPKTDPTKKETAEEKKKREEKDVAGWNFVATPTSGPPPLTVRFMPVCKIDCASIQTFLWSFGDGDSVEIKKTPDKAFVKHVYESPGVFSVTLKIEAAPDIIIEKPNLIVVGASKEELSNPPEIRLKNRPEKVVVAEINLEGSAESFDAPLVQLLINNKNVLRNKAKNTFFNQKVALSPGKNIITIIAEDTRGAKAQEVIVVTRIVPKVKSVADRLGVSALPFYLTGEVADISVVANDNVAVALVQQKRFKYVNRSTVEAAVREMNLSGAGLVNPATAVRAGSRTRAEAIIIGMVKEGKDSIEIMANVVDVETAKVMVTRDVFQKDKSLKNLKFMAQSLAAKINSSFPILQGQVQQGGAVNLGSKDRLLVGMRVILFTVDPNSGATKEVGQGAVASVSAENSTIRVGPGMIAMKGGDLVITK